MNLIAKSVLAVFLLVSAIACIYGMIDTIIKLIKLKDDESNNR